jgi:AAA+ superfamily predicted ATPase
MMAEVFVQLMGPGGESLGRLRQGASALIAEAEQVAREQKLTKRTALTAVLQGHLNDAGYQVGDSELSAAAAGLDSVRRGERLSSVQVTVGAVDGGHQAGRYPAEKKQDLSRKVVPMSANPNRSQVVSFFELERTYPNNEAHEWYKRLVGIDEHKKRLLVELEILLYPEQLEAWSRKHHGRRVLHLCELQRNRVPLVLLEGDVGTGKTALAETIGDALARHVGGKKHAHLLKINTQIRGTGQVGEMSDLIAQAFAQAEARARSLGGEPVLLLIDEADALAATRDTQQMHHEDKAGLNTVLQRLDNLRLAKLPLAVIFITNRPDALDPAVKRRAALRLTFERPNDRARAELFKTSVPELHLKQDQLDELVRLTGEREEKNDGIPFTASDITDRLLPSALREAYSIDRELRYEDLLEQALRIKPTPRMGTT